MVGEPGIGPGTSRTPSERYTTKPLPELSALYANKAVYLLRPYKWKKPLNSGFNFIKIGAAGFEPTASRSRTVRATSCATPRYTDTCKNNLP